MFLLNLIKNKFFLEFHWSLEFANIYSILWTKVVGFCYQSKLEHAMLPVVMLQVSAVPVLTN